MDNVAYGEWSSPFTSEMVSQAVSNYEHIQVDGNSVYWIENRPAEGRRVLMRYENGDAKEITPKEYSVVSRVHEYGGRAYVVDQGIVYFVNQKDQNLYRQIANEVQLITKEGIRLAEPVVTPEGIIAVAEEHTEKGVKNFLALINIDSGEVKTLHEGFDFYGSPVLNHNKSKLAWMTWSHPNMPWHETKLWMGFLVKDGLRAEHIVAGREGESIIQPLWSEDDELYFLSDLSGWWNPYRLEGQSGTRNLFPASVEFGRPLWSLGMRSWDFDGKAVFAPFQKDGRWGLAKISKDDKEISPLNVTDISSFVISKGCAYFIAGFADDYRKVVKYDLNSGESEIIAGVSLSKDLKENYCSIGEPVSFKNRSGDVVHCFYYPPKNSRYTPLEGTKPPLIVRAHGGPTGQVFGSLNLTVQFWTSRGFAFVDVNYRGSTGYGKNYRDALDGKWGISDLEDCEDAALYFAEKGVVDPKRMAIEGSSAGGYTVLCAMTFGSVFSAGCSHYGVSDLTLLAKETHKFESHYLDRLVGKYPEEERIYQERSPLCHVDRISRPMIFFQGLEDKVVLPNQAQLMHDKLKENGIFSELFLYSGEGHGFRTAATVKDVLDRQLAFLRGL